MVCLAVKPCFIRSCLLFDPQCIICSTT